jgi:hypothetical protein
MGVLVKEPTATCELRGRVVPVEGVECRIAKAIHVLQAREIAG